MRRRMLMSIKKSILPKEYQEVEYIKKDGYTQYILTDIIPNKNQDYIIEFVPTGIFNYLCGSDSAWDSGAFNVSYDANNPRHNGLRILNYGELYASGYRTNIGKTIKIEIFGETNKVIISENNIVKVRANIPAGIITTQYPLAIFTTNRDGIPQVTDVFLQQYKLKKFIIKENSIDIANYIPCYRKSDNKPGMYDIVSNKFFTNAGTGEFLVGQNIN